MLRTQYANEQIKPRYVNKFKVGDYVICRRGPCRQIVQQIAPYSFKLDNGFVGNERGMKLVNKSADYDSVVVPPAPGETNVNDPVVVPPNDPLRRSQRDVQPPIRYGYDD